MLSVLLAYENKRSVAHIWVLKSLKSGVKVRGIYQKSSGLILERFLPFTSLSSNRDQGSPTFSVNRQMVNFGSVGHLISIANYFTLGRMKEGNDKHTKVRATLF